MTTPCGVRSDWWAAEAVPHDESLVVATALVELERRIGRIEALVPANTAVLAMNTALVITVAGRLFQSF